MTMKYFSLMLLGALWLTACGPESQTSAKSQPQSTSPTSDHPFIYAVAPGTIVTGKLIMGPVHKISVEGKSASMFKKEVASNCRPTKVGSKGIPKQISVGDTVRVGDHEIRVGYIVAWRLLEGDLGKCLFYESTLDPPVDDVCVVDGLWVDVGRCRILEAPEIRLPPEYSK